MPNISIRNYTNNDYEAVKGILQDSELFEPHWDSREVLGKMISQYPEAILVAEKYGEVVGNVYVLGIWEAQIFRLAVKKEQRNRGIASLLLDAAEEIMKQRGIKEYQLFLMQKMKNLKDSTKREDSKAVKKHTDVCGKDCNNYFSSTLSTKNN